VNSPRIVQARKKPAEYGKTIDDAATFTWITWNESVDAT
jgi:hypothetical protein